ncbi:MAG: hypothetical protein DWQ06_10230 [Calditrichaeota bacterium]|nr:MAG: hypothetical protein DWQ06_10230 [Calditrichota bacterium]
MNFTNEIFRKLIHLAYILIPISYYFQTKSEFLTWFVPFAFLCLAIDLLRLKVKTVREIFDSLFGKMLRGAEQKRLTNASLFIFATLITILVFEDKFVVVAGNSVAVISDTLSALLGRKFGKKKIFKQKSWVGSISFLVSSFVTIYAFPESNLTIAFCGALMGTLTEIFSDKIPDDFTIPLIVSSVLFLLTL